MKRTPLPDTSPTPIGLSLSSTNEGKPKEVTKDTTETNLGHGAGALAPISVPPILLESDEPSYKLETGSSQKHGFVEKTSETQSQSAALPETYGTGRLMLTARDPRCLYAHWDLTFEQQKHYRDLSENHRLQLRVYRNVVGGPLVAEEVVHPESSHSFVVLEPSAGKYVAELGYYPQGGAWTAVAGSDSIATPLEVIPDKQPIQFATLNFAPAGSFEAAAPQITIPRESNQPGSAPAPPATHLAPEFPLPRSWRSSAAPDLAKRYEPESLLPVLEEASYSPDDPARLEMIQALMDAEIIDAPQWMSPAPGPGQEWTEEQKRELEELGGWTYIHRRQLGSQEIEELIRAVALPQEIELEAQSAPERSVSSGMLSGAPPIERRDFWFSVNAELVIYGATEPDAAVTIGGRRVRLRPDGTFSYRFSLPDGSYELPLAARSAQGDERRAELSFYRGTRYGGEVQALVRNFELKPPAAENLD
jgi:uncharacterized protein